VAVAKVRVYSIPNFDDDPQDDAVQVQECSDISDGLDDEENRLSSPGSEYKLCPFQKGKMVDSPSNQALTWAADLKLFSLQSGPLQIWTTNVFIGCCIMM
jgi:hypothetical protein